MRNRGRGGIGLNPRGRTASSYGMVADQAVESENGIVVAVDALQDLASSMRRMEGESLSLADKKSQTAAGATGKSSRAANRAAQEILNALSGMSSALSGVSQVMSAYFSKTFSGAAGQTLTETVTGSWITTSTVVLADSAELGTSPYWGMFDLWQDNTIAGSFDIKVRNTGAAPAGTYFFKWMANG